MKTKNSGIKRGQAGFTLVELLVVVLIIGVLASIAIPQYLRVVEKSRAGEIGDSLGTIESAEERYMAKVGSYTPNFTEFDVSIPNGDGTGVFAGASGALKDYTVALTLSAGQYSLAYTRKSPAPGYFGQYTIGVGPCGINTAGVAGACTLTETNCANTGKCLDLVQ